MIDSSTPIAPGAQPWLLPGGPIGILVVHGYGGSIGDYRSFAEQLHSFHYTVSGMRVAGHGQGITALGQADVYDWRESVFVAARQLGQQCTEVVIVGSSFGGALAVDYAAHAGLAVSGLVLINMPFQYRQAAIKKIGLRFIKLVTPNLRKSGLRPVDKQHYAELGSTTAWPITGLLATQKFVSTFVRPALPRIQPPVLILTNSSDPYVSGHSATAMLDTLGTDRKQLVVIPGHTHRPFRDPASVKFMVEQVHDFIQTRLAKNPK